MLACTATSVFLLTGAFMVMENILPGDKRLEIVKEAKSLPIVIASARVLSEALPKNLEHLGTSSIERTADQAKKVLEKGVYDRLVRPYGFVILLMLMVTGWLPGLIGTPLSFLMGWLLP